MKKIASKTILKIKKTKTIFAKRIKSEVGHEGDACKGDFHEY